jgi:hypothetical protein
MVSVGPNEGFGKGTDLLFALLYCFHPRLPSKQEGDGASG